MKKFILILAFYLVLIPTIAIASFDYNSKEFRSIIVQLDMQGHADHDFSTCTIQKVYYDEVVEMLNDGKNEEEIISYYVKEYGQAALRIPDTKGIGVIAWAMPAVGFLLGAVVVGLGIKRLTIRKKEVSIESVPQAMSKTEQEILEKTFEEERRKLF